MTTDLAGSSPFIPGLEPAPLTGGVRDAYAKTIDRMRRDGVLDDMHEGLCVNLLRLAEIIDSERKAYAVSQATREAVEIMKLLHEAAAAQGDDEFRALVAQLRSDD
ncbi:hypothetical protein [Microbacterium rhizophilus]|uniref:hypothetical protein n=1 Tax=Microbacterium rhizophilus TaxID=3138934 RepID=UPI0031EB266D